MAKYAIDSTTLTGIADAIREKSKTTGAIATSKMAESILAIKGGLSLDVVTASALPATVTDGQIVVITDTTPGTAYIDTDEPTSPATGDVWVRVGAKATAALTLTEESPYLRNGLVSAAQWKGYWAYIAGYLGDGGQWKQFAYGFPPIGTALNDMTWEQISAISEAGIADKYFSVGDAKRITISGKIGSVTFSNVTAWAFILSVYHNPEYEGGKFVHFQLFKDAQIGGKNLAFIDSKYGAAGTSTAHYVMNTSANNNGGWANCNMRKTILGNTNTPTSPLANSYLAALPADLRAVMKGATKYSDNVGGTSAASNITPTIDYLWLPSEFEMYGKSDRANPYESTKQKQYAYYAAGNSPVFFKQSNTSDTAYCWARSVVKDDTANFTLLGMDGTSNESASNYGRGLAPCFCV